MLPWSGIDTTAWSTKRLSTAEFELADLRRLVNHGTHVMDIACGPRTVTAQMANLPPGFDAPPSWDWADDAAADCDIVAVQLDWNTVLDTSGGSMNVHILDALMYILSRCDKEPRLRSISAGAPWPVRTMAARCWRQPWTSLSRCSKGALEIVVPAGNSYQSRTHANATLATGEQQSLSWCVQADDRTQSFLELWMAGHGPMLGEPACASRRPAALRLPWIGGG